MSLFFLKFSPNFFTIQQESRGEKTWKSPEEWVNQSTKIIQYKSQEVKRWIKFFSVAFCNFSFSFSLSKVSWKTIPNQACELSEGKGKIMDYFYSLAMSRTIEVNTSSKEENSWLYWAIERYNFFNLQTFLGFGIWCLKSL